MCPWWAITVRLSAVSRGKSVENLGRAPVPEWEELARAAWPGRVPALLARFAARHYLIAWLGSLLALVLGAWLRLGWLVLAAWAVGALIEWLSTTADPPTVRLLDLVGVRAQYRALLRSLVAAAGVLAVAGEAAANAGLAYVAVVLVLQLVWALQPVLATWLWRAAPPLQYLPGARVQPAPLAAHVRVYARGAGTPVVFVLLEFAALADALWTAPLPSASLWAFFDITFSIALAETAVIYLAWTLWQAYRLRGTAKRSGADLIEALGALDPAPSFLVYISLAARQSKYIANQWLPALTALPQNGLILVREASQLEPLGPVRHPVLYAPTPRDVERLTLPSLKVAFYLAYGERNGQLQRDPNLKHVMLLHGDSDKATSANNLARGVDEIWVAGPAAIERYRAAGVHLSADTFAVIGRPQVAGLPVGPTGNERPVVLYAPTFEGYYDQTAYSSLDTMGPKLIERLLADHPQLQVWFRPHPASGVLRPSMLEAINRIEAMLRTAGNGHLVTADRELDLADCLAATDLLISDISSVATDFLYTERPIITCDPLGKPDPQFRDEFPSTASSYLLHRGLEALDDVLAQALGPDPLHAERIAMKKYILGDTPDGPQAAFEANVARLTTGRS